MQISILFIASALTLGATSAYAAPVAQGTPFAGFGGPQGLGAAGPPGIPGIEASKFSIPGGLGGAGGAGLFGKRPQFGRPDAPSKDRKADFEGALKKLCKSKYATSGGQTRRGGFGDIVQRLCKAKSSGADAPGGFGDFIKKLPKLKGDGEAGSKKDDEKVKDTKPSSKDDKPATKAPAEKPSSKESDKPSSDEAEEPSE